MVMASHSTLPFPSRLTPLIGRQSDLERILSLSQNPSVRLVTILGPGGVGKTRLALELAGVLQGQFQDGVTFVPLAPLKDIDELLPTLAGILGVQLPPGGDLQQAVLEHLAPQQILLVLDNFENLLEEATLVSDILVHCPQVKILVTSREKLNLEAETLYHLGGLLLPPQTNLGNIKDYGAVELCLQKAWQVRPGFSLTPENAPDIIRICHLVDGNPLGILLAAAWLEHFSPQEIAEQISHSLDFLAHERRDAEPRHANMRAVFDSSFQRLNDRLQTVFRKLAVFRGGFTLAAAVAVAGANLRSLIALVEKSLLTRDPQTGRYELHELLRQYAGERLVAASDHKQVMTAHAEYYVCFVHEREKQLISPAQTAALAEIQADLDNIRQAFFRVSENRDFDSVRLMLPGLYAFCDMRSRFYEGEALFRFTSEQLAPRPEEEPNPTWALALLSWYDMVTYVERFESFDQIISQAQLCTNVADPLARASGLILLGAIAEDGHDFRTAIRHYEEGMQSYSPLDDFYWINMRIGLCRQALKEYPEAIRVFQSCLKRGKEMGERVKTGWSLLNIGDTLLLQGDPVEAQHSLEQACASFTAAGTWIGVLWSNHSLSRAALALHDPARGRELAEEARKLAQQLHSSSWTWKTDDLLRQIDPQLSQPLHETKSQVDEALSARELEVLQLLKSNLRGPEIAERLVVSLNTVRYHTKNIYRKLRANSRLEAIQRAKELGL